MSFQNLDDVLQEVVASAVGPVPGLHLYTAPPKAVLQDGGATLLAAGLAPAAVVYAGGAAPPALRLEVAACQVQPGPNFRVHESLHELQCNGSFTSGIIPFTFNFRICNGLGATSKSSAFWFLPWMPTAEA